MRQAAGVAYEEHGGGSSASGRPPLVLIHGAGGMHLHWPAGVRRLRQAHVFALDLPGHGDSPGPGETTISGYRRAVAAWLESLGMPPAVFVGHSMGGALALALALESPDRTAGLVLVGSGARLRVHPAFLQATRAGALRGEDLGELMSWWYSPAASPKLLGLAGRRLAATPSDVLHGDLIACDGFDVMERLHSIDRPALVVVGEDDRMTPVKYARYLCDHLPQARLAVIPEAGHMAMLEQPDRFQAIVSDWLRTTFPAG